jgi:hypothetical protein
MGHMKTDSPGEPVFFELFSGSSVSREYGLQYLQSG